MSGVLLAASLANPQPRLEGRSLTSLGTSVSGNNWLRITLGATVTTRESGVTTDRGPWLLAPGDTCDYEIRCTIVSGDVLLDAEFAPEDTWLTCSESTAFTSTLAPIVNDTLTGVWRIDIREASTGVIRASATFPVSATCTDCA